MTKIATPHFDFESKKVFQKPAMEIIEADLDQQLLAYSVQSEGLGDNDDLSIDEDHKSGDAWGDAW